MNLDTERMFFAWFTALAIIAMIIVWSTPFIISLSYEQPIASTFLGDFIDSLYLSIITSTISTLMVLIVSLPASYCISRFLHGFRRKVILALLMTPIMISPSAIGSSLLLFLTRNPVGRILHNSLYIINDPKGVITAQATIGFPISISFYTALFSSVSREYEEVALVYGLDRVRYFFKILLPMLKKQVFLGAVLVYARVFADFGASLIVGGGIKGRTWTLPIFIYGITQQGELVLLSITLALYFTTAFLIYLLLFSAER